MFISISILKCVTLWLYNPIFFTYSLSLLHTQNTNIPPNQHLKPDSLYQLVFKVMIHVESKSRDV